MRLPPCPPRRYLIVGSCRPDARSSDHGRHTVRQSPHRYANHRADGNRRDNRTVLRSQKIVMVATRLVSPCRVFLRRYLNAECLLEAFPFLAAGLLYVTTAARFVVGGDNGEFSTLMVTGGAAHPPGYPLYVLYLRAMRWLPAVSPAHRAALATSLLAAVGVFALQRACRAWGVSKPTAAVSATLYAFSPLAWYLGTHAEVFAVNALLAACILVLAGPHGPTRCATRSGLLGLVAGLGLANHHSIVLLAPVGLLATVQAIRQSERRAKALGAALLGLLIGLLPYLYLLGHGRTAAWSWGQTVDPTGLLFHFRRGEYGTTQLSLGNAAPEIGPHLIALAKTLVMGLLGVPIVAFALLIWSAFRKALPRTAGNERHATSHVGLVMSFLLCGPPLCDAVQRSARRAWRQRCGALSSTARARAYGPCRNSCRQNDL